MKIIIEECDITSGNWQTIGGPYSAVDTATTALEGFPVLLDKCVRLLFTDVDEPLDKLLPGGCRVIEYVNDGSTKLVRNTFENLYKEYESENRLPNEAADGIAVDNRANRRQEMTDMIESLLTT